MRGLKRDQIKDVKRVWNGEEGGKEEKNESNIVQKMEKVGKKQDIEGRGGEGERS